MEYGEEEGDVCGRDGCDGRMFFDEVQNCTCFISPPCNRCVDNPLICNECGYEPGEYEEKVKEPNNSFLPDWMRGM